MDSTDKTAEEIGTASFRNFMKTWLGDEVEFDIERCDHEPGMAAFRIRINTYKDDVYLGRVSIVFGYSMVENFEKEGVSE